MKIHYQNIDLNKRELIKEHKAFCNQKEMFNVTSILSLCSCKNCLKKMKKHNIITEEVFTKIMTSLNKK